MYVFIRPNMEKCVLIFQRLSSIGFLFFCWWSNCMFNSKRAGSLVTSAYHRSSGNHSFYRASLCV